MLLLDSGVTSVVAFADQNNRYWVFSRYRFALEAAGAAGRLPGRRTDLGVNNRLPMYEMSDIQEIACEEFSPVRCCPGVSGLDESPTVALGSQREFAEDW